MSEENFKLPKTIEEIQAITHVPTTEATESFGNFVNKYLTNADNFTPLTAEQAWAVIGCHRVWQSSDERKAEKDALKETRAVESEEKKAERLAKKAEREADKERKAALKAEKDAAKKAKDADSDEDLDEDDDEEGLETEAEEKPKRRRRAPVAAATSGEF
jgi:DNA-directed RNA polymerase delta subunit